MGRPASTAAVSQAGSRFASARRRAGWSRGWGGQGGLGAVRLRQLCGARPKTAAYQADTRHGGPRRPSHPAPPPPTVLSKVGGQGGAGGHRAQGGAGGGGGGGQLGEHWVAGGGPWMRGVGRSGPLARWRCTCVRHPLLRARHTRGPCRTLPPAVYSFRPASISALCFRTEARPWPASRPAQGRRWVSQGRRRRWVPDRSGQIHMKALERRPCSQTCGRSCDEAPHGRLEGLAFEGRLSARAAAAAAVGALGLHGTAAGGQQAVRGAGQGGLRACQERWASVQLGLGRLRHPWPLDAPTCTKHLAWSAVASPGDALEQGQGRAGAAFSDASSAVTAGADATTAAANQGASAWRAKHMIVHLSSLACVVVT